MDLTNITTYQAVVYQSRANRAIKTQYEKVLGEHGITAMQWSILGFVNDAGKAGVRVSDLAKKLGTSLAFITNSINTLEIKGAVKRAGNTSDSRSKLICLTPAYRTKFEGIEKQLRASINDWLLSLASKSELDTYSTLLQKIAGDDK